MLYHHPDLIQRLEARTEYEPNTGCWLWSGWGAGSNAAYGEISFNAKRLLTHRAAYECWVGPIPEGLVVCHKCDTPNCINPSHLFAGTPRDNTHDMVRKSRGGVPPHKFGEGHYKAKISEADVVEIRKRRSAGAAVKDLAADYSLSESNIYAICSGTIWKKQAVVA